MSDPDPATPPEPAAAVRPPARNMADIARLFLDGVRPTPPNGAPKRTGPKDRAAPPTPPPAPPLPAPQSPTAPRLVVEPPPAPPLRPLPHLQLALLDSADRSASGHLASAAAALAQLHDTSIFILSLHNAGFTIDVLGVKSPADLPMIRPAAVSPDLQIARALFTLRHAAGHWIIAAPDRRVPSFAPLAAAVPDWLLLTSISDREIVAAYHQLKHARGAASHAHDPSVVMFADDPAKAAVVHARLRRAAREFLKIDLPLAAITPLEGGEMVSPLRVADIPLSASTTDHRAIYATILDELCGLASEPENHTPPPAESAPAPSPESQPVGHDLDGPLDALAGSAIDVAMQAHRSAAAANALIDHLANVLDPEEREALNAELPEPETQPAGARHGNAVLAAPHPEDDEQLQRAEDPVGAFSPSIKNQKSKIKNPASLRAIPLSEPASFPDRPAQWNAIESSIPDLLPGSTILDARAPMSWAAESCLVVDPAERGGTLHVWTLYQDGASWFALREWATEHKNLLALTQRDLPLDKTASVSVHIVLPLQDPAVPSRPPDISSLLRTAPANVHLYRLHPLQYQSHPALVVVPIA